MTSFNKEKILFILCDCKSEILCIEYDKEWGFADLAIYENFASYRHKLSFYQKMRYIWQILWNNKPYADQMVLTKQQLNELKIFLESI